MAWPCITRVCCLARFWNQLDKSDLAVPLTLHNYSDIDEPAEEGGDGAQRRARIPTGGGRGHPRAACALPVSASAPSLQQPASLPGVKRPSKKGRGGGRRKESVPAETQYQQDFRAWPVQKRGALPWGGEGRRGELLGAAPAAAASHALVHGGPHVYVLQTTEPAAGRKHGGFKQIWASASPPGARKTTSYRQEYRPWTGAKRSRASKMKQGFIIPEDHFVRETSYKADFKIPEVKANFSPNPSAVFQAPSRILNV